MPVDAMEVLDAAPLTTVQDLGRHGYQRYGVPVSGAMDPVALRIANLLVGNDERVAALELTLAGPAIRFLTETIVAVTGADLRPSVDGTLLPAWEAVPVRQDSTLMFRGARAGARAYLAVAGGIDVPVVLGSRSTFVRSRLGGLDGRPLQAGDRLQVPADLVAVNARRMSRWKIPVPATRATLRVIPGPQDTAFAPETLRLFLSSTYVVSGQSDRMGYRLEGPRLAQLAGADIISDGTPSGAVQVTGDGLPIVLLADRGTAGGYTKIATVISVDVARLGQMAPGNEVRFTPVTEAEAHQALRQQEELISSVAHSAPRFFRRRLFTLARDRGEYRALGAFEEIRNEGGDEPLPPIKVVVEGSTYEVSQRWAVAGLPGQASVLPRASEEAGPGDPQVLAALASAVAVATDPIPRDYPFVV